MHDKEKDFAIDVRDTASIIKLADWCYENLTEEDYTATIIMMFPLLYRFRFTCPKVLVMAALNA